MRITRARLRFHFERQKGRCYLMLDGKCWERDGAMRWRAGNAEDSATVEHVWPESKGRKRHGPKLILAACSKCNNLKGSKEPTPAQLQFAIDEHAAWVAHQTKRGKTLTPYGEGTQRQHFRQLQERVAWDGPVLPWPRQG